MHTCFHAHSSSKQSGVKHTSDREVTEITAQCQSGFRDVWLFGFRDAALLSVIANVCLKLCLHTQSVSTFLVFIVEQRKKLLSVEECGLQDTDKRKN